MFDLSPDKDAIRRTGQCACGDVRVSAKVTKTYGVCHCRSCRRWAGGVWMGVIAGKTAEVEGPVTVWKSSTWADRGHCKTCGTAVWHRFRATGHTTLGQGLFDDQTDWKMTREIFCNEQPDHYAFGNGAQALTGWAFFWALLTGKMAK